MSKNDELNIHLIFRLVLGSPHTRIIVLHYLNAVHISIQRVFFIARKKTHFNKPIHYFYTCMSWHRIISNHFLFVSSVSYRILSVQNWLNVIQLTEFQRQNTVLLWWVKQALLFWIDTNWTLKGIGELQRFNNSSVLELVSSAATTTTTATNTSLPAYMLDQRSVWDVRRVVKWQKGHLSGLTLCRPLINLSPSNKQTYTMTFLFKFMGTLKQETKTDHLWLVGRIHQLTMTGIGSALFRVNRIFKFNLFTLLPGLVWFVCYLVHFVLCIFNFTKTITVA